MRGRRAGCADLAEPCESGMSQGATSIFPTPERGPGAGKTGLSAGMVTVPLRPHEEHSRSSRRRTRGLPTAGRRVRPRRCAGTRVLVLLLAVLGLLAERDDRAGEDGLGHGAEFLDLGAHIEGLFKCVVLGRLGEVLQVDGAEFGL